MELGEVFNFHRLKRMEALDDSPLGKKYSGVAFYEKDNLSPFRRCIGIYRYSQDDVDHGRKIYKTDGEGTLYWPQKPDGSWGYDEKNFPTVALAVLIDPKDEINVEENTIDQKIDENKARRLRKRAERDSADFFGKAEVVLQPVQGSRKWRMTSTFAGATIKEEAVTETLENITSGLEQTMLRASRQSGMHGYELEPTYYLMDGEESLSGMDEMIAAYAAAVKDITPLEGLSCGVEGGGKKEEVED